MSQVPFWTRLSVQISSAMSRAALVILLGVAASGLTGCMSITAAQRGLLADSMMSWDPQEDPCAALEGGVYAVGNMENSRVYAGGSQGASSGCPSCK